MFGFRLFIYIYYPLPEKGKNDSGEYKIWMQSTGISFFPILSPYLLKKIRYLNSTNISYKMVE